MFGAMSPAEEAATLKWMLKRTISASCHGTEDKAAAMKVANHVQPIERRDSDGEQAPRRTPF